MPQRDRWRHDIATGRRLRRTVTFVTLGVASLLSDRLSDLLSDLVCDVLSDRLSDLLSDILSDRLGLSLGLVWASHVASK